MGRDAVGSFTDPNDSFRASNAAALDRPGGPHAIGFGMVHEDACTNFAGSVVTDVPSERAPL